LISIKQQIFQRITQKANFSCFTDPNKTIMSFHFKDNTLSPSNFHLNVVLLYVYINAQTSKL